MQITAMRYAYPEAAGFTIDRKNGHPAYTFLHFFNPVWLLSEGELIHTAPHACILYAPGQVQYFKSELPLTHDWIHFTDISEEALLTLGVRCGRVTYPRHPSFITLLAREMENEFLSSFRGREAMLSCKLQELLLKWSRASEGGDSTAVSEEMAERLLSLRKECFASLALHHTVGEMAARVNLSPSRFFAVYRAFFGCSPMEDLIAARINSAKNALTARADSIEEIAAVLGYNSTTHFIRQFKKEVGVSPGAYRQKGH